MFFFISSAEGFKLGSEKHTTEVIVKKSGFLQLTSGIEGLSVLKTTKVTLHNLNVLSNICQNPLFCLSG